VSPDFFAAPEGTVSLSESQMVLPWGPAGR